MWSSSIHLGPLVFLGSSDSGGVQYELSKFVACSRAELFPASVVLLCCNAGPKNKISLQRFIKSLFKSVLKSESQENQ